MTTDLNAIAALQKAVSRLTRSKMFHDVKAKLEPVGATLWITLDGGEHSEVSCKLVDAGEDRLKWHT